MDGRIKVDCRMPRCTSCKGRNARKDAEQAQWIGITTHPITPTTRKSFPGPSVNNPREVSTNTISDEMREWALCVSSGTAVVAMAEAEAAAAAATDAAAAALIAAEAAAAVVVELAELPRGPTPLLLLPLTLVL